eukprot:TRINITY_DN2215_c0_g1_i1.p1 TRINITY_DN2215_c0_g1~~TRINITY_DN2215_c0_g1_i1.p1  ORF type:complete len:479 (-),score=13.81 TRINITY_DN2215_c0_g1_i1:782-2218(-)
MGENLFDRNLSTLQFQLRLLFMASSTRDIPIIERFNYLNIAFRNLMEFNSIRLPEIRELDVYTILKDKEFDILNTCNNINKSPMFDTIYKDKRFEDRLSNIAFTKLDLDKMERFVGTSYREVEPHLNDNSLYLFIENCEMDRSVPDLLTLSDEFHVIKIPKAFVFNNLNINILKTAIRMYTSNHNLENARNMGLFRLVRDQSLEFIYKQKNQKEYMESLSTLLEGQKTNIMSQAFVYDISGDDLDVCYDYRTPMLSTEIRCLGVSDRFLLGPDFAYDIITEVFDKNGSMNNHMYFTNFKSYQYPLECEIFDEIQGPDTINRTSDVMVRTPYDSYNNILRFIDKVSRDSDTQSVFITLYRVSETSQIIESLCDAASAGKSVYVYIELMARGDEEQNIDVYKKLSRAGVHICNHHKDYLKVHMKAFLAITKAGKTYSLISTGNFNESTAKIYTDTHYVTKKYQCWDGIVKDIQVSLFNPT